MFSEALLYLGALLPFVWGIAHLFPTRSVVAGFGGITQDNRRIITVEWIVEGVALIFIGVFIASVTMIDPGGAVSSTVYLLSALALFSLAIVSAFTGFRVRFFPFKLCPFLLTAAGLCLLVGGWDDPVLLSLASLR
jgi:hypothetical protein